MSDEPVYCAECIVQRYELGTLSTKARDEAPRVKPAVSYYLGTALCVTHLVEIAAQPVTDDLAARRASR